MGQGGRTIQIVGIAQRLELLRDKNLTLGAFSERLAAIHGDAPLVEEHDTGLRLTYREAATTIARRAAALRRRIATGDRVVLALPNGYAVFLAAQTVARAGGVAVPVNPKMQPAEVEHVVSDSSAALVVRDADELDDGTREGDEHSEAAPVDSDEVAALFYTSGTTGKPRGAELTHRALVGRATGGALFPSGLLRNEAVTGMPVAHIAGFTVLVQAGALGVPVYVLPKFRPDVALDVIEQRRATIFVGVPAMYRMMEEAGADERDLSSVRLWASGADVMPFALARRFQQRGAAAELPLLGKRGDAAFVDGYGMVELGGGAAVKILPPGPLFPVRGLVAVPLPGYHMKVIDDTGNAVAQGEVGELAIKGPGVMRGYHGKPDATRETLTDDGWLRTGDLARRRRLGLIEFAGRKKDVIKHGGYSVFAAEVEDVLGEHPAVLESAVVGVPDARKGEVPAAVVRVRDDAALSEPELVEWARERLSEYKVPQRVAFVDELPRTGTEKVRKQDLVRLFDS
jgi:acyl-CoA synthetase (AMP-forming)/AMP-acid ligase II